LLILNAGGAILLVFFDPSGPYSKFPGAWNPLLGRFLDPTGKKPKGGKGLLGLEFENGFLPEREGELGPRGKNGPRPRVFLG